MDHYLHKYWLLFSQAITVLLAALFIISTLKPEWLWESNVNGLVKTISIKENGNIVELSPGSYHEAVKRSIPAVVNIFTSSAPENKTGKHVKPNPSNPLFNFFFGDELPLDQSTSSLGSGVLIASEGFILTNHHVINGAESIEVTLADERRVKAQVIGSDPETDIAVLKIENKNLPDPITFGKIESVHVGDVVLAIGNPFGVGQTVTSGIISALGRDHVGINTFENFIQTDAAINPGNSGGALIDARGNLIGINTAIFSNNGASMGIGFAIPINLAKQVMESIITKGEVIRGWIGVEPQNLSLEQIKTMGLPNNQKGILLTGILEGGPADRAGIKPGDVISSVNHHEIKNVRELLNTIALIKPGETADIRIIRNRKDLNLWVVVGKRPRPNAKEQK